MLGGGDDDTVLIFEIGAQNGGVCIHIGYRGDQPRVSQTKPKAGKKREEDIKDWAAEKFSWGVDPLRLICLHGGQQALQEQYLILCEAVVCGVFQSGGCDLVLVIRFRGSQVGARRFRDPVHFDKLLQPSARNRRGNLRAGCLG